MMCEAEEIIWEYLDEYGSLNYEMESLLKWFGVDDLVDWFVNGYFVR